MTEAATKFVGSILSAYTAGLIGESGLTESGEAVVSRLCEESGDDPATARAEIVTYWRRHYPSLANRGRP